MLRHMVYTPMARVNGVFSRYHLSEVLSALVP